MQLDQNHIKLQIKSIYFLQIPYRMGVISSLSKKVMNELCDQPVIQETELKQFANSIEDGLFRASQNMKSNLVYQSTHLVHKLVTSYETSYSHDYETQLFVLDEPELESQHLTHTLIKNDYEASKKRLSSILTAISQEQIHNK